MKNKIKWIYFFTEDYNFWHHHLQSRLRDNFNLQPIPIPPLKTGNVANSHHFKGISLKIELIINSIEENIGSSIIFSDCTLWINKDQVNQLEKKIDQLKDRFDLIFADNGFDREANIGFILIKCNQATLNFYKKILSDFNEKSWDQKTINDKLPGISILRTTKFKPIHHIRYLYQFAKKILNKNSITWSLFEKSEIICGYKLPSEFRENYFIFKQFIHPSDPTSNWNQRLNNLYENGILEYGELKNNLRPQKYTQSLTPR